MKITSMLTSVLVIALSALFAFGVAAYPDRPVRLLVGFTAGANTDLTARLLAERLREELGQPVIVDNKAGAGGVIAAEVLTNSPPDGHTLMLGTSGMLAILPAIRKLPFDTLRDFTPVVPVTGASFFLVVRSGLPVNNLNEFIEYAKRSPTKLTYTSPGNGTYNHLGAERFANMIGVEVERIPFRGDAEALAAIMGGHVDMGFISFGLAVPHVSSDRVKLLALTAPKRHPKAPQVPTLKEGGIDFVLQSWNAILGPRNMPSDIVSRLHAAVDKIIRDEKVQQKFDEIGLFAIPDTTEGLRKHMESELIYWREEARRINLTLE